jgi:hypothetical protein
VGVRGEHLFEFPVPVRLQRAAGLPDLPFQAGEADRPVFRALPDREQVAGLGVEQEQEPVEEGERGPVRLVQFPAGGGAVLRAGLQQPGGEQCEHPIEDLLLEPVAQVPGEGLALPERLLQEAAAARR